MERPFTKSRPTPRSKGSRDNPKALYPPPAPGSTGHHHLISEEIASCHNHDEAQEKGPQPSWRAARSPHASVVRVYHTSGLDASAKGSWWCIHVLLKE